MKIRLQDVIRECIECKACCATCKYNMLECTVKIDGYFPYELANYYWLCGSSPELAKALYTNEEIEL